MRLSYKIIKEPYKELSDINASTIKENEVLILMSKQDENAKTFNFDCTTSTILRRNVENTFRSVTDVMYISDYALKINTEDIRIDHIEYVMKCFEFNNDKEDIEYIESAIMWLTVEEHNKVFGDLSTATNTVVKTTKATKVTKEEKEEDFKIILESDSKIKTEEEKFNESLQIEDLLLSKFFDEF